MSESVGESWHREIKSGVGYTYVNEKKFCICAACKQVKAGLGNTMET